MDLKQAIGIMDIQRPHRGTIEKLEAYEMSVMSLKAWERVLTRLEAHKANPNLNGLRIAFQEAQNIIMQELHKIE